jgi:hypothetical protein
VPPEKALRNMHRRAAGHLQPFALLCRKLAIMNMYAFYQRQCTLTSGPVKDARGVSVSWGYVGSEDLELKRMPRGGGKK